MDLTQYLNNVMKHPEKLRHESGLTYEQLLRREAKRFKKILQRELEDAYYSYTPKKYVRTGDILASFDVDNVFTFNMINNTIELGIVINDNAFHQSIFDGYGLANTIMLLNDGYKVEKGWHKDIEYFGYREGYHFIEKAIDEFENTNKYGLRVEFIRPALYFE